MAFPVMDHPNALRFQGFRYPVPDGEHIVAFVQGAVGCGLPVVPVPFFIAFGGMAVGDQHRWPVGFQLPIQGLGHQGGAVRLDPAQRRYRHCLGIFGGKDRTDRLRGIVHGGRGFKGIGKRKGPNCLFGLFL